MDDLNGLLATRKSTGKPPRKGEPFGWYNGRVNHKRQPAGKNDNRDDLKDENTGWAFALFPTPGRQPSPVYSSKERCSVVGERHLFGAEGAFLVVSPKTVARLRRPRHRLPVTPVRSGPKGIISINRRSFQTAQPKSVSRLLHRALPHARTSSSTNVLKGTVAQTLRFNLTV
jgi:hypothetical protein